MSTKILIIFICAAVGTAAGYLVMKSYRRNFAYLDGVCKLIGELKRNISYRRDVASSVLGALDIESAQLKKNVEEYIAFAGGKDEKPNISRGFLPLEVYTRVCDLFCSLGKSDGSSQLDELNMFGDAFKSMRDGAEQKCKKYGTIAVKLGFLLGLGVGVLTL